MEYEIDDDPQGETEMYDHDDARPQVRRRRRDKAMFFPEETQQH